MCNCERFAGTTNMSVNMKISLALVCLRCGCDASVHKLWEEIQLKPEIKLKSDSKTTNKARIEWPENPVIKEDFGMPLQLCKVWLNFV
jgi:hypothetical protein